MAPLPAGALKPLRRSASQPGAAPSSGAGRRRRWRRTRTALQRLPRCAGCGRRRRARRLGDCSSWSESVFLLRARRRRRGHPRTTRRPRGRPSRLRSQRLGGKPRQQPRLLPPPLHHLQRLAAAAGLPCSRWPWKRPWKRQRRRPRPRRTGSLQLALLMASRLLLRTCPEPGRRQLRGAYSGTAKRWINVLQSF